MAIVAYRVRAGFNLLVPSVDPAAPPKQYDAGDTINLPEDAGDGIHQLERVQPPAPEK